MENRTTTFPKITTSFCTRECSRQENDDFATKKRHEFNLKIFVLKLLSISIILFSFFETNFFNKVRIK